MHACLYCNSNNAVYLIQQARHSEEELLAQAMCQFSASTELKGRVYAVGRACSSSTNAASCSDICQDTQLTTQDSQTATGYDWYCVGAYHVYKNRPSTNLNGDNGTSTLGLKSMKLRCDKTGCGPNFCCCFAGFPS